MAIPAPNATTDLSFESCPKEGPTVRTSRTLIFTGSAPERNKIAKSLASSKDLLPEIVALPPVIACCTTGFVSTSPSRVMAIRRPIFLDVKSANFFAPSSLSSIATRGCLF